MSRLRAIVCAVVAGLIVGEGLSAGQTGGLNRGRGPVTAPAPKVWTHPGLKFPFPEKVADFKQDTMRWKGRDESNVEVSYQGGPAGGGASVGVYIFPVPNVGALPGDTPEALKARQLKQALVDIKKDVASIKVSGTKQVSEEEYEFKEGGRTHKGIRSVSEITYDLGVRKMIYDFEIWVFVEEGWVVEYRIGYDRADAAVAKPALEKFLAALTWK